MRELLDWALVFGVNEEPALAEISSELASARLQVAFRTPSTHTPKRIHIVSLESFPESFRRCADSLEHAFLRHNVPVTHHRYATQNTLAELTQVGQGEVVHILGQCGIRPFLNSTARNWVLTIHGAAPYSLPADLHSPADSALEEIRANADRLPHVICPTFNARREISTAYGIPRHKIDPIPHFFDSDVFAQDGHRFDPGARYFLLVSNYQKKKNYVAVLEAFHELVSRDRQQDLLLLMAGDGTPDLLKLIQDACDRWPLLNGRIRFLGHVEDLASVYRGAIALVSMSHQEGFGMPYIEAALCGIPVIGPKPSLLAAAWVSQPTREILGSAGLYADPLRPLDLTAMMSILASDEEIRKIVGDRSYQRAREYVDPAFLLDRYLYVYGKVLNNRDTAKQ